MVRNNRVTYRRRHSYNTKSNKIKLVKTPGGRLTVQYRRKTSAGPSCGDCGKHLHGIPALRPKEYSRLSKRQKTVARAYGGNRCAGCVRTRIVRAFLIEEQKVVKSVLNNQPKASSSKKKSGKKSKKARKQRRN
mmetsp:Transcript_15689/g.23518  ORF Transcript_15689/g.23518 Transcript_15689/m.23518 type:complete len:134 (+) Transcript_15689:67-468(+)